MSIVVDDAGAATAQAVELTLDAGGRVDARDEQSAGGDDASTTLTLRVPAEAFDSLVEALRELGEVDQLATTSTDVTDAVVDVEARIVALEKTIARLEGFQDAAADVDDLIALEGESGTRQAELERLVAEQQSLADRVEWSSLQLFLRTPAAAPQVLPASFGDGVVVGWNAMVVFLSGLVVIFGVMLPWLLLAVVATVAVVAIVRVVRSRRARRAAPQMAPDAGTGAPLPVAWPAPDAEARSGQPRA